MGPYRSVDALVKAEAITEANLQSALDAFAANRGIEAAELGGGYSLNLQAVVRASSFAQLALAKPGASDTLKRSAVRTAIPAKRNEAPVACPNWIYNNRNQVERLWARLKEW